MVMMVRQMKGSMCRSASLTMPEGRGAEKSKKDKKLAGLVFFSSPPPLLFLLRVSQASPPFTENEYAV
jgi:hypothetical protein